MSADDTAPSGEGAREVRLVNGWVVPSSAAVAVGKFRPEGVLGYRANGMPDAPLRATRREAEDDWAAAR